MKIKEQQELLDILIQLLKDCNEESEKRLLRAIELQAKQISFYSQLTDLDQSLESISKYANEFIQLVAKVSDEFPIINIKQ